MRRTGRANLTGLIVAVAFAALSAYTVLFLLPRLVGA